RAHERVEHDVAAPRVELDQPLGQLDGERRGVAHTDRRFGRELPHIERGFHELVGRDGGLAVAHAIEPALRPDDDPPPHVTPRRPATAGWPGAGRTPTRPIRPRPSPSATRSRRAARGEAGPGGWWSRPRPDCGTACGRGWRR